MTVDINFGILDRNNWESAAPPPTTQLGSSWFASSTLQDYTQYLFVSSTVGYMYSPKGDGWQLMPSPSLSGSYNVGFATVFHPMGGRGFPTAGTTTTITTGLNLQSNLTGYTIRIIAGPNAGTEAVIKSNTTGTNSVITVVTPFATAITTASEFILWTGRVYALNPGTLTASYFKYYDVATNTWNLAGIGGMPGTITANDTRFISTSSYGNSPFVTGQATGATSTTLTNSGKAWTVNNWANYQVRITSGTGAGQFRVITSNTANTLTVPAWTITPDATSAYAIEGNDDAIYLVGNTSTAIYRYSVFNNSATALSPSTPRAGNTGPGTSGSWVNEVTDPLWLDETNYLNGRYLYCFRGGTSSVLDRYDIASNTWVNDFAWSPKTELMVIGTSFAYYGNHIYAMVNSSTSIPERLLRLNVVTQTMEGYSSYVGPFAIGGGGDRLAIAKIKDGSKIYPYLYHIHYNQYHLSRLLLA